MASPTTPPPIAHLRDCPARSAADSEPLTSSVVLPACCTDALQRLAAISRDDGDDKVDLFRSALAADDATDSDHSLLQLLLLIARGNGGRPQSTAVLETSVRALAVLPMLDLPPPRRDRLTHLALEVSAMVLTTAPQSCCTGNLGEFAVKTVSNLLCRREEGEVVLAMATRVLALLLDDQSDADATPPGLNEGTVAALNQLLMRLPNQRVEIAKTACELLLRLADQASMIQTMVSCQVIGTLALVLQRSRGAAEVVSAVVRLLLRIATCAPVQGQIINEGLLSELFLTILHFGDDLQVATVATTVLAATMEFAVECRLDLSPFLEAPQCTGAVLIDAAACRADNAELTANAVRCLVFASSNLADLPQFINAETIEAMLKLFMSATPTDARSVIATGLRSIITSLPRATINTFVVSDASTTFPALFMCLRCFRDDLLFSSQVFAIVTRHWKASRQNVQSIAGYVEIAVDRICLALSRESPPERVEFVELCNFLREILFAQGGGSAISSCGGVELLALLRANLSDEAADASAPADQAQNTMSVRFCATRIASALLQQLEEMQSGVPTLMTNDDVSSELPDHGDSAVSVSKRRARHATSERPDDNYYADYVVSATRSENEIFTSRRRVSCSSGGDILSDNAPLDPTSVRGNSEPGAGIVSDEADERPSSGSSGSNDADVAGDDPSDASDADGDDIDGENNSFKLSVEEEAVLADSNGGAGLYELGNEDDDNQQIEGEATLSAAKATVSPMTSPTHHKYHQLPDTLMPGSLTAFRVDPSHLESHPYCYISPSGIRFPKHPMRSKRGAVTKYTTSSTVRDEDDLVWSAPKSKERYVKPDPDAAAQFIAEATDRRSRFSLADVASRAQTVYRSASLHELLRRRVQSAAVYRHEPSWRLLDCVNTAQGGDRDGGDDGECLYPVPNDSLAFASSSHDSLTFDSMFESGNLARAIRVGESEYDLVLRRDLRTNGNMQWFFFAISNAQPAPSTTGTPRQYRFNIINLCKPDSLFNHGLQPVIYSVRAAREQGIGWRRGGCDVHYFPNQYPRTPLSNGSSSASSANSSSSTVGTCYYTLTFTLELAERDDTYLIAHSFPYTLHTHRLHMDSLLRYLETGDDRSSANVRRHQCEEYLLTSRTRPILRRTELCKTLGGTSCDLLTISEFSADANNTRELASRRVVVITSRVHPGEPQASWMMRGVIDFLVGDSDVARVLRRMFVFHLVPMLNPDGVYYGNNRCSLSACDLNRQWLNPSAETHPTIFHTKQLIAREHSTRGVVFACDLHGHSRKHNVFMYGCDTKKRPNQRARSFASGLAASPGSFLSLPDCSFKVSRDKEATARVVLAYTLEIPWSFTLEASFCGTNLNSSSEDCYDALGGVHFTTQQYREVGAALCEAIFTNCVTDGSIRERLCATVDDHTVDFPRTVEPFVREAALVTPGSSGSAGGKAKGPPKSTAGDSKVAASSKRRSGSSRSVTGDSSSSQISGNANARRSSRTPPQQPTPSPRAPFPLRKSPSIVVPETVIPVVGTTNDSSAGHIAAPFELVAVNSPRPRLSGKKIRVKKAKSKINRVGHDPQSPALHRSPTAADCLDAPRSSMVESRIAIGLASSSQQSGTRAGPLWSSLASSPSIEMSVEAMGLAGIRTPLSAGSVPLPDLCRQPTYEAAYVSLPSSIYSTTGADPAMTPSISTRSPKPPSSRLRFRGGGRQYAAVSSGYQTRQHRSAILDLLREDTMVTTTYEQNLLNASTISLRQRSVTGVDSSGSSSISSDNGATSPSSSNCRLNPLNWEIPTAPPRATVTSPPSLPSLS